MEEDDEVTLEAGVNISTGARKATSVQLCSKANEQLSNRELGQVCLHGLRCPSPMYHSISLA